MTSDELLTRFNWRQMMTLDLELSEEDRDSMVICSVLSEGENGELDLEMEHEIHVRKCRTEEKMQVIEATFYF